MTELYEENQKKAKNQLMRCPKCGYKREPEDSECPKCGVIYAKYETIHSRREKEEKESIYDFHHSPKVKDMGIIKFTPKIITLFAVGMGFLLVLLIVVRNYQGADTKRQQLKKKSVVTVRESLDEQKIKKMLREEILLDENTVRSNIARACSATVKIVTPFCAGSGFLVTDDGYLITNKHVIECAYKGHEDIFKKYNSMKKAVASMSERVNLLKWGKDWQRYKREESRLLRAQSQLDKFVNKHYKQLFGVLFTALFSDGTVRDVTVVQVSFGYDLALLRAEGANEFQFIKIGSSRKLSPSEPLYAIGNPLALEEIVTRGIFSSIRGNWIQSSVMVNPGNSGGPLITREGKVVGVNTILAKGPGGGYTLSIPIETAINEFSNYLGYVISNEY